MNEPIKRTPGPWRVEQRTIWPQEGHAVASVPGDSKATKAVAAGNAALIAAAPDLLEWLEAAVDVLDGQRESGEPSGAFDIDGAHALIAKAKGEQC